MPLFESDARMESPWSGEVRHAVGSCRLGSGLTRYLRARYLRGLLVVCLWLQMLSVDAGGTSLQLTIDSVSTRQTPLLDAELTVQDEGQRPFPGLTSEQIQISVDGQRIDTFTFSALRSPGQREKIIFLLDNSQNMRGDAFYRARTAIRMVLARLAPVDEVGLATCSYDLDVLQDLTMEKFSINRQLNSISLVHGNLSLSSILTKVFQIWDDTTLKGATLVILTTDFSEPFELPLTDFADKLRVASISLIAVSVQPPQRTADMRNVFNILGATFFTFLNPDDIWSLMRSIDARSEGRYRLSLETPHGKDFGIHSLKAVVELFGINAGASIMYIGSSGDGINPGTLHPRHFFGTSGFFLFCMALTQFLSILLLFVSEKMGWYRQVRFSAYPFVAFVGLTGGFLVALLLSKMP